MSWLQDIADTGTPYAETASEKRNIILTNSISLAGAAAVLFLLIFRTAYKSPFDSVSPWLFAGTIVFTVPIFFNSLGYTKLSRIAQCWIPPVFVMMVSYSVLREQEVTVVSYIGLRYYMLAFCCPPFLIFDLPRERIFILAFMGPVAGLLLFDPIFDLLGVGYTGPDMFDYSFNNVRIVLSLFVVGAACYILKSRADRNEDLNKKLIAELADKNEEIQRQASDRVHQLNQELYTRLQQLSEREFILNQSQRIAKIGSWEYTIQGAVIFWSDEMYNIFGVDKTFDIQTHNLAEVIGGNAGELIVLSSNDLLKNGQPYDLTFQTKTPVGYIKWLRMYAFAVKEGEKILGMRGICHDVTYYKEAEELLRATDKKYRGLFEQASDAILITDFKGNFTDVNSSFCKLFGYTREELLHMNINQVIDEEEIKTRPIAFDRLAEGMHVFNERRMVAKDGTMRDVEANVKRLDDTSIVAIVRDVTELRKVQKQIQISEAKFRGAFEFSAIGMTIVSIDGRWLQVNREFCNITGYTESELLKLRFRDITHPDDIDTNEELFRQALRGEIDSYQLEKRYIHRNGGIIWGNLNVSMIRDGQGNPIYCVSQIEDITEAREAKEKLIQSQANLRATINNANVMIWSIDRSYRLLTFNDPFSAYMRKHYGAELRAGHRIFPNLENDQQVEMAERWKPRYARALEGETFEVEEPRFGADWFYSLTPIIEGNQVIGASIFAENISKRKAHDRELAEANKKIDELKLMALRSVMSPHFIFNVLNSIQFFIAKNDRLNAINYLSTFSKLIRSILNHSVTNRIKLSEEVDMLKNYVQLEMTRFEKKFSFVFEVGPEIDVDSVEIPSLLIQPYVENAILHGLYNKRSPGTLSIRVSEGKEQVIFEIEDDGVGRTEAMRLRQQNFPSHKSLGIRLTEERLKLIKQQNNAAFEVEDLVNEHGPCGTRVRISIPC